MTVASSLRELRRRPGGVALSATIAAVATVAATVGVEIADRVFLSPLPYPDPAGLVMVWSSFPEMPRAPLSGPELRDVRERVPGLAQAGAVWTTSAALLEGERPEPLRVALVTGNLLPLLGARAALGRTLEASDGGHGGDPVVVLGGGLWQRHLGGDPAVVGRSLRLAGGWGFAGGRFTVVGVLPRGLRLALPPEAGLVTEPDVWVAWPQDVLEGRREDYYLRVLARLAAGASAPDVQRQLEVLDRQLVAEHPDYEGRSRGFFAMRLDDEVTRGLRPAVAILLAGALVLLAIAAADVAALALARALERRREMATRVALGASRGRILRMLLAEAALPVAVGGMLGALLARQAVLALRATAPAQVIAGGSAGLGVPALLAAAAVTLATALASALAVTAGAPSRSPAELLGGVRSPTGSGGRVRRALVVGQSGIATALLVGAALAARSFAALIAVDPGFSADGVLALRVDLPPGRYPGPAQVAAFDRELARRLRGLPGVRAVGATSHLPFDALPNWTSGCRWPGDERAETAFEADARSVSPGYADAAGLRPLRGRFLDVVDATGGEPAIVVDELLAARAPGGGDALGSFLEVSLWAGAGRGFETVQARIVGVVAHARHSDLTRSVRPQLYASLAQSGRNQLGVLVRADADPADLAEAVRGELARVDPELALNGPRAFQDYLDSARDPDRAAALIAAGFALASTLLAMAGVYGVLGHAVSRRRREIGVRLALGAVPADLRRLVLAEGLRLAAAGLALGLLTALGLARLLGGLLFGVSPADPASLAAATLLVGSAVVVAGWRPAARAAGLDPLDSLREE
jgi:predicted permease